MSDFGARTEYIESIAEQNKLIAHNRPVAEGSSSLRNSFFRINDMEELNAACVNWAHFPCMVHAGYDFVYRQNVTGIPHKVISNNLMFLAMLDKQSFPLDADAIQDAYDRALVPLEQTIAYLLNDHYENGSCGNLFLFDTNRAKVVRVGPFNSNLYGWLLTWYDEEKAKGTVYNSNDWFGDSDILTENNSPTLTEDNNNLIAEV